MKNKKWILLLIIAFPSFFWLILETSTINSRKLPFYGPKNLDQNHDTIYHVVPDRFGIQTITPSDSAIKYLSLDTFPIYAIMFVSPELRPDAYRLTGLWEYINYKKTKIEGIPFVLVTKSENGKSLAYDELKNLDSAKNIQFLTLQSSIFENAVKSYFSGKPYYIDYSFFVLVDQNRHVRGYYDARYVSEMKRLIEEYQHLRLKEEKQKLIETNEIKKSEK
ncbi:MAG: hypothetical protein JNL60_10270 [Bacteroidia bacterium]|nr:hypothetical protein [Bacteroidia bacterium]